MNGKELYEIGPDPGQVNDIADSSPEVVARLRGEYEHWWTDVTERFDEYLEIPIGAPEAKLVRLTSFDWNGGGPPNQRVIQDAPLVNGFWALEVERAGRYEITLRQQPPEAGFPIEGSRAKLKIAGIEEETAIEPGAASVSFDVMLSPGKTKLQTWFIASDGRERGAYYAYVDYKGGELT